MNNLCLHLGKLIKKIILIAINNNRNKRSKCEKVNKKSASNKSIQVFETKKK